MTFTKLESRLRLVSPAECAGIFDVSERTIYNWIENGTLPSVRVGGRRRILASEIEKIIAGGVSKAEAR